MLSLLLVTYQPSLAYRDNKYQMEGYRLGKGQERKEN